MAPDSNWLSLSEAAELLGVHFTTLRRWANQGLVEYVRTPGGKRKFQRAALEAFLARHRSVVQEPSPLLQLTDQALARTRQGLADGDLAHQRWYLQTTDAQRAHMRSTGSRMIALLFQFCARESGGEVFLAEARRIAEEYGQFCCSSGLEISECVQTFLFFRRPVLTAIHAAGSLHGGGDHDGRRLFEKLHLFLDEMMIAMVAEYHRYAAQHPRIDR